MAKVYASITTKENCNPVVAPSNKPHLVLQEKRPVLNDVKNNRNEKRDLLSNYVKAKKPSTTICPEVAKETVKVARVEPYNRASTATERLGNLVLASESTTSTTNERQESRPEENIASATDYSSVYQEDATLTSFSSRRFPENVHDIDTSNNVNLCPQFAADIYEYLRERESVMSVSENFMKTQKYITSRMRNTLVDWIVQVHRRFDLLVETLYLTVSIVDRFLEVQCIPKDIFQLVGITATFIACKFEEVYFPEINDLLYVTDNSYTKKQVMEMEISILVGLNFNVGCPLPIQFLRRISRAANADVKTHATAKYLMELSLVDSKLAPCPPSLIAASSFFVAMKALHPMEPSWSAQLAFYSGYSVDLLLPTVRQICGNLIYAKTGKLTAVYEKYEERKNLRVSSMPQLTSTAMYKLSRSYVVGSFLVA